MSTGVKRPREEAADGLPYGSDSDRSSYRDSRRRDEPGHRDWRDAHLNGGGRRHQDRSESHRRDRSRDNDSRKDYRSDRAKRPPYDTRDRRDEGPSSGRYSSRGSYYDKSHGRERSYRSQPYPPPGKNGSRQGTPTPNALAKPPTREQSTTPSDMREEGEISPRMSSLAIASPAPPRPSEPSTPQVESEFKIEPPTQEPLKNEIEQAEDEELTAEQIIAARRAKRQAILAKYSAATQTPSPATSVHEVPTADRPSEGVSESAAPLPSVESVPISNLAPQNGDEAGHGLEAGASTPEESADPEFSLEKAADKGAALDDAKQQADGEQVYAAEYNPDQDRLDEQKRRGQTDATGNSDKMDVDEEEEEVEEEFEDDDVDDMFAAIMEKPEKKKRRVKKSTSAAPARAATNVDSAADPEGYYQIILGEALDNGRYQVFSTLGKGMFSAVVRARITAGEKDEVGKEVAIKIMRSQESMYKAGLKEVAILEKLKAADPEDKKHLIRLEHTFEHRGHLCLVFESLSMNLREVVKRFGKDVGLNIRAVRAYAQQLFLSLSLLKKCNIMHADIKPDNILVNESKATLKLCDLGSASDVSENDIAPYLVSRFYRAPEIILGLPYDPALDVWSVGCTLYELYTGKILFPGRTNNHMLLLMMELKGKISAKMIKKAKFGDVHFDEHGAFLSVEPDKITGTDTTRTVFIQKPTRDLRTRLVPPSVAKANDEESRTILAFVDLLEKCLILDPSKRLTPRDALAHPFIRGA
ncbi:U4/U6 small nuclear ribonucleoprotein prp4 [Tulasnella sp. 408]|nr:U4/U6 small nuclear ribonucleoprotein prp4 [Tulasnella sp. 408]